MRVLTVVHRYPMYDRASGDLRFFQMLGMLVRRHDVTLTCYGASEQTQLVGELETQRYRESLVGIGVSVADANPLKVMQRGRFDALLFEFYHAAAHHLGNARLFQRDAIAIIDSVDVHFNRLFARARLSGSPQGLEEAKKVRQHEMAIYRKADHVIAVSIQDRDILLAEERSLSVDVVPNIHVMQPLDDGSQRQADSLLFVGGFGHEPNVDAAQYLCSEIMPLIWRQVPGAKLRIAGDSPPDVIRKLAGPGIEVLGYVPSLEPYLRASQVSVAPLRYGGGMKGKIGEAMAAGLPVVTTTTGIEGFGFAPERDLLVADNPRDFSSAVVALLQDAGLREAIRHAGWKFIADRFSPEVVEAELLGFFSKIATLPLRTPSSAERLKRVIPARLRYFLRQLG